MTLSPAAMTPHPSAHPMRGRRAARAGIGRLLPPTGFLIAMILAIGGATALAGPGQASGTTARSGSPSALAKARPPHRPFTAIALSERADPPGSAGGADAIAADDTSPPGTAADQNGADDATRGEERFHAEPPASEDPDFLYLHDAGEVGEGVSSATAATPAAAPMDTAPSRARALRALAGEGGLVVGTTFSFTPRVGLREGVAHSLDLGGRARPIGSFTPRYREARVSLSVNPPAGRPDHALGIEVGSQYLLEGGDVFGFADDDLLSPIERRAFHLGLLLNYEGFSLGAGVSREEGGLEGVRTRGFDVGFGWRSGGFETMVSLGGFTRSDSLSALVGATGDENFYRLELGAAYQISRRLRVSGGVRLFDYSSRILLGQDLAERSGVLYLGSRLRF